MRWSRVPHLLAVAALSLSLVACADKPPVFVNEAAEYSAETIGSVFGSATADDVLGTPISDAAELRSEALTELRRKGDEAAGAADLITRTFASDTAAVPVYVELARYDGADAVVVVEAIGPKGGDLRDMRVWVLSADGQVLYSGTR